MKYYIKTHHLIILVLFLVISCKNKTEKDTTQQATKALNVSGNYVSEDYSKRSEGYDWVSVSVSQAENNQLNISVRSRADKKKPTCTYDAVANKVDDSTYHAQINGKIIVFEFTNSDITITTGKQEDEGLLNFCCSGGSSIRGTYLKINESLDQSQIDKTKFSKILNLQDIGFNISSIE